MVENLFLKKNPLQGLLSSVNAVISTNERIEFITGHKTYNPAYTKILQTTTTYLCLSLLFWLCKLKKQDLGVLPTISQTKILLWNPTTLDILRNMSSVLYSLFVKWFINIAIAMTMIVFFFILYYVDKTIYNRALLRTYISYVHKCDLSPYLSALDFWNSPVWNIRFDELHFVLVWKQTGYFYQFLG